MEFLTIAAAGMMQSFCNNLSPNAAPGFLSSLCNNENIATDLGAHLSSGANVWLPGSTAFNTATTRWSSLDTPGISVVVEVATENDVAETVQAPQFIPMQYVD